MKLITKLKQIIYKFDFFSSKEFLRYKSQPQYRTLFGGLLSLCIIITLLVIFYTKLIGTMSKVVITSTSTNIYDNYPKPYKISSFSDSKFMIGVELMGYDLNSGKRYFDVFMRSYSRDSKTKRQFSQYYSLQPCTLNHWDGVGLQKDYLKQVNLTNWQCLPKNRAFKIQGKFTSSFWQTFQVGMKKCTDNFDPNRPCASQQQINNFLDKQGSLYFSIYFINPLINPTNKDYITYYIEDKNNIKFTKNKGTQGVFYLQEYRIITDESLLPFTQLTFERGGVINELAQKNQFQINNNNKQEYYCNFVLNKSGLIRRYLRSYQKIDNLLSYIGGLFGTIVIILFIANMYNGYCFQIDVGGCLFKVEQGQSVVDQLTKQSTSKKSSSKKSSHNKPTPSNILKTYNFIDFLIQNIYQMLTKFGFTIKWKQSSKYTQCQQQVSKQLDILYLLKRISFLQQTLNFIFDHHQIIGLHLQQKLTLQQTKKIRRNLHVKKRLIKCGKLLFTKINNKQQQKVHSQKSIQALNVAIQNSFNFQQFENKNMSNSLNKEFNNLIINHNIYQKSKKQFQNSTQMLQHIDLSSSEQQSLQSQQQQQINDYHKIIKSIELLEKQSENDNKMSKKIWQKIDPNIKRYIKVILNKKNTHMEGYQKQNNIGSPMKSIHNHRRRNYKLQPIQSKEQTSQFTTIKVKIQSSQNIDNFINQ